MRISLTLGVAVEFGCNWMDQHAPANWMSLIETDRLNMDSVEDCVLGQVFDGEAKYDELSQTYGVQMLSALGFTASHCDYTFTDLTDQWLYVLGANL